MLSPCLCDYGNVCVTRETNPLRELIGIKPTSQAAVPAMAP